MIQTTKIRFETQGHSDVIDLTRRLAQEVADSGITSGTVTVFVSGSTAGLTTIEYEPGLVSDLKEAFERLFPEALVYRHNEAWGDDNGHSHVRASMLGPSLTVPFHNKALTLGTWQQVILVDFDVRPRSREIVVQLAGE